MTPKWTHADIPDQSGRVAVVTGANAGLGYVTAQWLASKGAAVIMGCRSMEKGQTALKRLMDDNPDANLILRQLDLADLRSVRAFVEGIGKEYSKLDMLINNAGVMALPRRMETADGFEMHLGVNHLGHFALTGLLLPALESAEAARVVTVSSSVHHIGQLNFDNLMLERGYQRWRAYGNSKLANLLFTYELQRRLEAHNSPVRAMAAHPGYAATELQRHAPLAQIGNMLIAQSMEMGALPILLAATSPDAIGGAYYGPRGLFEQWGYPTRVGSNQRSRSPETAAKLWEVSEALTGVSYSL